jgi:hypothetical protein
MILGSVGAGKSSLLKFLSNAKNSIQNINGIKSCKKFIKNSLENPEGGPIAYYTSDAVKHIFKIGHGNFTFIEPPGLGYRCEDGNDVYFANIKKAMLDEG